MTTPLFRTKWRISTVSFAAAACPGRSGRWQLSGGIWSARRRCNSTVASNNAFTSLAPVASAPGVSTRLRTRRLGSYKLSNASRSSFCCCINCSNCRSVEAMSDLRSDMRSEMSSPIERNNRLRDMLGKSRARAERCKRMLTTQMERRPRNRASNTQIEE